MLRHTKVSIFVIACFLWMSLCHGIPATAQSAEESTSPDAVRLLWAPGQVVGDRTEIEALAIDPDVRRLVFLLDGEEVKSRKKPPWRVKIDFAEPPRLQHLTVRALGPGDRLLGEDTVEVNRARQPFRVFLDPTEGPEVRGKVSLPRGAELASIRVEIDGQLVANSSDTEFTVPLDGPPRQGQIVRAVATLRDGREIDDAKIAGDDNFQSTLDVRLVQIQTLVTDRSGRPVTDLTAADFAITENGKTREVDRVKPAEDTALVLGLLIDTSGSMEPIWPLVESSSNAFLDTVVRERDLVFLSDFASQVRLLHEATSDRAKIEQALSEIRPEGATILYDSIAFSMLQYRDRPGRRALVVITDGLDSGSQADPERAVEIGRKLGVPVYVIFLPTFRGGSSQQIFAQGIRAQEMKLLTEPTGGRLLRVGKGRDPSGQDGLMRAFRQIAAELHSQFIVTYYTDQSLADLEARDIEVTVPGRKKVEVRSVLAWDQIQ